MFCLYTGLQSFTHKPKTNDPYLSGYILAGDSRSSTPLSAPAAHRRFLYKSANSRSLTNIQDEGRAQSMGYSITRPNTLALDGYVYDPDYETPEGMSFVSSGEVSPTKIDASMKFSDKMNFVSSCEDNTIVKSSASIQQQIVPYQASMLESSKPSQLCNNDPLSSSKAQDQLVPSTRTTFSRETLLPDKKFGLRLCMSSFGEVSSITVASLNQWALTYNIVKSRI